MDISIHFLSIFHLNEKWDYNSDTSHLVQVIYSNSIFSLHPFSHGKPLFQYKWITMPCFSILHMQISELKATDHSGTHRTETFKNVKVVGENYFLSLKQCKCHLPSHPCHINLIFLEIFLVNPHSCDSSKRVTTLLIFMNLKKKIHDQVRNFLQAKIKLVNVRIWSPHLIWLLCGGGVYIGSQVEILGYNYQ